MVCIYFKHKDFFTSSNNRSEQITLATEDTILEIRNLNMSFGKDQVLSSLDMNIKEREIMCLLGANGAGKTSLIKVILGMIGPVSQGSEIYMKNSKGDVLSIKRDLK
jgi:ABC-type multidrug transport system ATPase subunit